MKNYRNILLLLLGISVLFSINSCFKDKSTPETITKYMDRIVSVTFPYNTIYNDEIKIDTSRTVEEQELYNDEKEFFDISGRLPYEIKISIGAVDPGNVDTFTVSVVLPDWFIQSIPQDSGVFIMVNMLESGCEGQLEVLEPYSSEFWTKSKIVNATLTGDLFINKNGEYVVTLVPVIMPINNRLNRGTNPLDSKCFGFPVADHTPGNKYGAPRPKNPKCVNNNFNPIHLGQDFPVPINTDVFAAASGKVEKGAESTESPTLGKVVIIDHGDGVKTKYAHLNSVIVSKDDKVQKGALIGKSGDSGRPGGEKKKPHLHFELIPNNNFGNGGCEDVSLRIDPIPIISKTCSDFTLNIYSGNNQSAKFGNQLTSPLIVQVLNNQNLPAANLSVSFSVTNGNGTLSSTNVLTDANGKAQTIWTLGAYGNFTQNVKATVTNSSGQNINNSPVTFSATPYLAIGDIFGGGVIFFIFTPTDPGYVVGEVHGYISSLTDQSSGAAWCPDDYDSTVISTIESSNEFGLANTNNIISVCGNGTYAANIARNYNGGGYSDWYLPTEIQLSLMLNTIGQFAQTPFTNVGGFANNKYWSSVCRNSPTWFAAYIDFTNSSFVSFYHYRNLSYHVRAVRTF